MSNRLTPVFETARRCWNGEMVDEDEFLAPEKVPFDELTEQIMSGAVHDGKTVAAVLKAKLYLER